MGIKTYDINNELKHPGQVGTDLYKGVSRYFTQHVII